MDYSPSGSSVRGILQAKILQWIAVPSSRGSSQSRDWTRVSFLLHWQVGSLPLVPTGKLPLNKSISGASAFRSVKWRDARLSLMIRIQLSLKASDDPQVPAKSTLPKDSTQKDSGSGMSKKQEVSSSLESGCGWANSPLCAKIQSYSWPATLRATLNRAHNIQLPNVNLVRNSRRQSAGFQGSG